MGLAFIQILMLDIAFLALCVLAISPLIAYKKAAYAVLKRNFVGYFSNPTGYVFLCLFVLLTSFAAFWPHDFFTANLANLDQLNQVLPLIMLVFIPAITMSIWSEERRQGTDELLLTLPADDFDIVIGKYLAAAAIFTASLMFSQFSNYMVLASLSMGDLDTGLFFTTYLGYWLVGLAMLAIGMIASFLTSNMTVGFILGAAFNAPLAFAASAELIMPSGALARNISFWSLASNFDDLGRGVISLSSLFYFALVVAVGLYISMVLIGSRHWSGKGGPWMFLHFVVRATALILILGFGTMFFADHDVIRFDATAGQVSSLSPKTKELIRNLSDDHPIVIEAFVSGDVPEAYVQTKFNLLSLLKEFDSMSGGKIEVRLHDNLEPFSEEAALAEDRFGIQPTMVRTRSRGAFKDEEVILGAAFNCGLEKVVVPFFDYGIPVEYELIRSIGTVAEGERKKIGIVRTDAQLYGGFSFAGGMPRQIPRQEIVEELEKQYDVEEIDPTSPIEEDKYDMMVVVQPSSLGPQELPNVVAAVINGLPTAIFEDPAPIFLSSAPGTGEPKQAPGGGMFGGGQQPQPKGNIRDLWTAIGIEPPGEPNFQGGFNPDVAWQQYNPYQKLQIQGIPDSWVFASDESPGADNAINSEEPITAGLNEILFPVPGAIVAAANSELKITPLVKTGDFAGRMRYEQYRNNQQDPARLKGAQGNPTGEQIIVARIRGVGGEESDDEEATAGDATDGNGDTAAKPIDVVYVADIDLMMSAFMRIRARPDDDEEMNWRFENVNFLLNIVDSLSGDDDYIEIRRRKPYHTTLKKVEERVRSQRDQEFRNRVEYEKNYNDEDKKIEEENQKLNKELNDEIEELRQQQREGGDVSSADILSKVQLASIKEQELAQKLQVKREQMQRERDDQIKEGRRQTDLKILDIQNFYKFLAVALPPIPPLLVGLIVFVSRRLREREGIVKSRLRS